jgi:hypothetical protein
MTADRSYASPAAFRRALTDRLSALALAKKGKWTLTQLQRQMACDRLLERLYLVDDGWIVKGATALLARDLSMRATIDVDVYRAQETEIAEADLRAAAGRGTSAAARADRHAEHRAARLSGLPAAGSPG